MSDIKSMGGMVKFEMSGLSELDKHIKKLSDKIQRRVIAKGLRAGARVVQKRAKALAPKKTGTLRKAISVVTMKSKPGTGRVAVTIKSGKKAKYDAYYAHFVEFGTRQHAIGRSSVLTQTRTGRPGKQTGAVHPGSRRRPFMRPAFDETNKEQLDAIGETLAREIIKENEKI